MNKLYLFLLMAIFTSGCSTSRDVSKNEKKQILQDYVLYESLILAFKKDSIFFQDATMGIYHDLGAPEIHIYKKVLDKIAQERVDSLAPLQISDYNGKKAIFMELLNIYKDPKSKKKLFEEIKKSGSKND